MNKIKIEDYRGFEIFYDKKEFDFIGINKRINKKLESKGLFYLKESIKDLQEKPINKKFIIDNDFSKTIYYHNQLLFELENATLYSLTGNNSLKLKINMFFGRSKTNIKTIEYEFECKIEKYVNWLSQ